MFNIGGGEMVVIFLLALLVLGPERLPKAMGQVGRAVAQMRKLSSGFQDEIRRAMDPIEAPFRPGEQTLPGPMPSITDEVRVVATADEAEPEAEPVVLDKAPDADVAVEPGTGTPVVDEAPRRSVTPLRPRLDPVDEDDDRATG